MEKDSNNKDHTKQDFFFSNTDFKDMSLTPQTIKALSNKGLITATEVQEKCIPIAMRGKTSCALLKQAQGKHWLFLFQLLKC